MAPAPSFSHYVFVDFENVPSVDLSAVGELQVHVTLLMGKHQTRIDTALFRQALQFADRIEVIEVGVSGRNALDMVLAAYLGRASHEHPKARFTVVSKDKDFDPLITHLRTNHVEVTREPNFFAHHAKRPHVTLPADAPKATRPKVPHHHLEVPAIKLQKLIARFTTGTGPLPRNKERLMHLLSAHFGNKLPPEEIEAVFNELVRQELVIPSADGKMRYPKR